MECVEYEQNGLQAKLQLAEHELNRYTGAVIRVHSGVGNLQKHVAKGSFASLQDMEV